MLHWGQRVWMLFDVRFTLVCTVGKRKDMRCVWADAIVREIFVVPPHFILDFISPIFLENKFVSFEFTENYIQLQSRPKLGKSKHFCSSDFTWNQFCDWFHVKCSSRLFWNFHIFWECISCILGFDSWIHEKWRKSSNEMKVWETISLA